MRSLARPFKRGPSAVADPVVPRPGEYHHGHPHRHGRRGVHEHQHGYRGSPAAPRGRAVPWPHWFAEHPHVHPDPADVDRLEIPPAPGARGVR